MPCISAVINFGKSYSLTSYHQESGRAGRDGGLAMTVTSPDFLSTSGPMGEQQKAKEMSEWLFDQSQCRRLRLTAYFDDVAMDCHNTHCELCDVCRQLSVTSMQQSSTTSPSSTRGFSSSRIYGSSAVSTINPPFSKSIPSVFQRRNDQIASSTITSDMRASRYSLANTDLTTRSSLSTTVPSLSVQLNAARNAAQIKSGDKLCNELLASINRIGDRCLFCVGFGTSSLSAHNILSCPHISRGCAVCLSNAHYRADCPIAFKL